jgi:hypothetical protein
MPTPLTTFLDALAVLDICEHLIDACERGFDRIGTKADLCLAVLRHCGLRVD